MTDRLIDELQRSRTDPALLPHAMRYYVAEQSGDRPPTRMRDDLVEAGLDAAAIDDLVLHLQADAELLQAASLAILQDGYDDPGSRASAEGALHGAQAKLPMVDAGLIAIAVVFGMWLVATKGRKTHRTEIRRSADGSWEEIETTEWYGPGDALEAITKVVGLNPGPGGDAPAGELPGVDSPANPPGQD
jgi:hypothetical protein